MRGAAQNCHVSDDCGERASGHKLSPRFRTRTNFSSISINWGWYGSARLNARASLKAGDDALLAIAVAVVLLLGVRV